jgi:hypothetical protein
LLAHSFHLTPLSLNRFKKNENVISLNMAIQPADTHTVNPINMFTSSPNSAAGVPAADIGSADKTSIKKEPQSPSASRKASVASQKRTTTSAAVLSRKDDPEKRASHNAIERARRESLNSRFLVSFAQFYGSNTV